MGEWSVFNPEGPVLQDILILALQSFFLLSFVYRELSDILYHASVELGRKIESLCTVFSEGSGNSANRKILNLAHVALEYQTVCFLPLPMLCFHRVRWGSGLTGPEVEVCEIITPNTDVCVGSLSLLVPPLRLLLKVRLTDSLDTAVTM